VTHVKAQRALGMEELGPERSGLRIQVDGAGNGVVTQAGRARC
jgi:hypothetical protein